MPVTAVTSRGFKTRDGLWLAAALLLHAALLLIPVSQDREIESTSHPLTIQLQLRTPVIDPFVQDEPDTLSPEPDPPDPLPEPISETLQEPLPQMADQDETEPAAEASTRPEPAMSTAVLLQSAAERDWLETAVEPVRKLGEFLPRAEPDNWRPRISLEANRFDGMTAPRNVEILDRWVSADGSHNVVINTPTGETLCGRGLAWDPMQPLVEHVMQFRLCGGGGKRTFEMPDRYHRNARLLD